MNDLEPGQWKRAGSTAICCLMRAQELGPLGFVADTETLRRAACAARAPVYAGTEKVGVLTGVKFAFRTGSLLAYLHLDSPLPQPETHLALPVLAPRGVTCARCGQTFLKSYQEPCACLHQMGALLFADVFVSSVLFLANAHEDKMIQEERDSYLRRQFVGLIDALQLMDPV